MRPSLSLCALLTSDALSRSLQHLLLGDAEADPPRDSFGADRYFLTQFRHEQDFLHFVEREKRHIDCLLLQATPVLPQILTQLQARSILLPALILIADVDAKIDTAIAPSLSSSPEWTYHCATLNLASYQLSQIDQAIELAINKFLQLSAVDQLAEPPQELHSSAPARSTDSILMQQQRRLAEKLKERLGYLGVYYKRNPQNFLRRMAPDQRQEFLQQLKAEYRDIVLTYFSSDSSLNQKIDELVNLAFFADVSVPQIVEIHMELMDEFSKQLKLEGRGDDVLLDYRLTLIDTIAHLCEMYRRSIPRES